MAVAGDLSSVFTKVYADFICIFVRSPFELENKDDIVNEAFLGHKTIDGKSVKVCCVERDYKPTIAKGEILHLWCKSSRKPKKKRSINYWA